MRKAYRFLTYLSTWIQNTGFFGDTPCGGYFCGNIDSEHKWGSRHYWYFFMGVLLFLLSIVRVIVWAFWYWEPDHLKK